MYAPALAGRTPAMNQPTQIVSCEQERTRERPVASFDFPVLTVRNMRNKPSADDDDTSEDSSSFEDHAASLTPIAVAVPVNSNDNDDTSSAPLATSVDPSDSEARAAAEAAREACVADIRNHCDSYLQSNRDGRVSYVTWIATLHPENASVEIDPRFLIPGNPWLTVYEEAKDDFRKGRQPIAASSVSPSAPSIEDGTTGTTDQPSKTFSGFLDLVIGSSLALAAILSAFTIEICAAYCYLSYWLCHHICEKCRPLGMFSWLPFFLSYIIGQTFRFIDILLLFISVIIVESIAALNYLLCTILGCSHAVGKNAHQMTRRLSHHLRWAFRKPFKDWTPQRS